MDRRRELEEIFHRFGKGVGGFVLTRLGDPELAEEITARVFLKVVRGYSQLRGSVAPWLWTIVRNELARHFRDRKFSEPLTDELSDGSADPVEVLERRQALEKLGLALQQLPDDVQQMIYMKFFLNLSQREIAEATGVTESNAGVRIYRALQRLRAQLEPKEIFTQREQR
jgi:RNA polymerase sigma-70 factor (ECF subfamily)